MKDFTFEVEYDSKTKTLYIGQENSSGSKYHHVRDVKDVERAIGDFVDWFAEEPDAEQENNM